MRRPLLLSLVVLMLSAGAVSGEEWARKMFKETSHDFGNVARGAKTEYRFTFENIYVEPLHVVGVRSSCGCTSAEVTKRDFKTWEKGEVVATFNTNAFLGNHSATVTVTFDKPYFAETQLQVKGNIKGDVTLQPGVVELGTINAGQPAEQRISVARSGSGDWEIVDVRSANTNFEVDVLLTHRSNLQTAYDLVVRLKPTAPPGIVKDQLFLITNDANSTQIAVDVEGRVVSNIEVHPTSLLFLTLKPGEHRTKPVILRSKQPVKIVGIECDPCFSYALPTESRTTHSIPITFTAGQNVGKVAKEIKIKTDLGPQGIAVVKCQADVEPPQALQQPTAASPSSHPVDSQPPITTSDSNLKQLSPVPR
ncbi:MAG: DUF1573 domain-containing protein [Pirellulales bacterium]|nr:DUF1573 domain-containing protein [Pirellulales bacterium]